ncbi:MAG: AAA family ATPase [Chloroflexi bacterium]|nr:AAA family ATPase [Chloroflexota bacterium]
MESDSRSGTFVGRERELGFLRQRLDAAIAGQGGLIFITGEAGIGKTRLAREAQRLAQDRGLCWLAGRYDKDGSIAMQPYVEAVRQLLDSGRAERLLELAGPYAPELARIFPNLAAVLGDGLPAQQPALQDPQAARQRTIDAICHLFLGIARRQPMAFFLDDLHWAPSMELLHALARRAGSAPLLLLGAYRDPDLHETPALSQAVLAMNRERLFQALPLRGLVPREAAAMLEATLGQPPALLLVESLHALTGGNPFFLEEMARYLDERDALVQSNGALALKEGTALELPRSIRAVVEERLGRLSEEARRALAVASVIGEEFSLALVREVTGLSDDALAEAVDGSAAAFLIAPLAGGREAYAFAHSHVRQAVYDGIGAARRRRTHLLVGQAMERLHAPRLADYADALADAVDRAASASLIAPRAGGGREAYAFAHSHVRQAVYDGVGTARRRRYHLLVGQAMERLHAPRLEEHAEALAHHFLEGNDLAKATDYSIQAGERAFALHSWERARVNYEQALEVLESGLEDLPRKAQVLERLADVEMALGRTDLARHQQTLEVLLQLGDKRKAARMHRMIAGALASGASGRFNLIESNHYRVAANQLLEGEPDSPEKALTLSSLAHGLWRVLEVGQATQSAHQALEMAERLGDSDQMAFACTELGTANAFIGELDQARLYAQRAFETAQAGRDLYIASRAVLYPSSVWPWIHDQPWLALWLDRNRDLGQRTGLQRFQLIDPGTFALRWALTGHPNGAVNELRSFEAAQSTGSRVGSYHAHYGACAYAILGQWERADLVFAAAAADAESGHDPAMRLEALFPYARFLLDTGDLTKAEEVIQQGLGLACPAGAVTQELNLLPLACELRARQGRLEEAEAHLARAREILARPQPWRGLAAPVHLAEGQLAAAKREWDRSERAFTQALETEQAYGFLYHQGRILLAWSEAQAERANGHSGSDHGRGGVAPPVPHGQGDPAPTPALPADPRARGLELLSQAEAIRQQCAAK